jgi:hypothetical protein
VRDYNPENRSSDVSGLQAPNAETGQVLPKPHVRFGDLPSTANSFKWISGFAYARISGDVNQFEPAGH